MTDRILPGQKKVRLQLDSGAFSAWRQGKEIDFQAYMRLLKANKEHLDSYFNLDILPGQKGNRRTPVMIEKAAAASRENFLTMRRNGLNPIPVFHQQEDFRWLLLMLKDVEKDKDPYIALSTYKSLTSTDHMAWLDKCFEMFTPDGGSPKIKVHGLGVASFKLLKRYPWFSCDATSWALAAAFGAILVPVYRDGVPDYTSEPIKVVVTMNGQSDGLLHKEHFRRLGPLAQKRVLWYLEEEVGLTMDAVAGDKCYKDRARCAVHFFKKFGEALVDRPWRRRSGGFL